jgi:hypothetical protein
MPKMELINNPSQMPPKEVFAPSEAFLSPLFLPNTHTQYAIKPPIGFSPFTKQAI